MKTTSLSDINTFATATIGHTVNKKCCAYARILASRLFLKTANPMVTYGLHQAAVAGTARLPFSSAPAAAVYRRMQFGYRAICFCSNMQHRCSIIGKNYDTIPCAPCTASVKRLPRSSWRRSAIYAASRAAAPSSVSLASIQL